MSCVGCCKAIKPRYKRLVDDIFPVNPQDGLVKNNMDKLTFYALSSPEKLDRIGEYLASKLSRDVARKRYTLVKIAMDALDQLLVSCHDYSLNLFVESFLKMVQKLLECDELELQVLATASFVKFANIEEDTPSYHRRYDFFVSKFSVMCHGGTNNDKQRSRIRLSGVKGLQGVVRKTVSDELQVNIWDPIHMDKIVPSLLYNMHDPGFVPVDIESTKDDEHPAQVAETVLRDLICRASYGNLKPVLRPILVHMDNHKLWTPPTFVVKCFKIVMYSVQQQYAYVVIQALMSHLDTHQKSAPDIKAAIVDVLFEAVIIAAGASVGPSVLDVFNTLVKHLRISLDNKSSDETIRAQEKKFEESLINTIGQFANNLPDYQKIEIMMFVMAKFPQFTAEESYGLQMDVQLQTMLLKTLLKVATKYKTVNMANAFPQEFLQPLLRMSLFEEPGMRIIVQEILHTLIDRHENSEKLRHVQVIRDVAKMGIKLEKVSRPDSLFMKKHGSQFYWYLCENMRLESNKVDNFEALYRTMALITVETGSRDIVSDLIRLALDMQEIASDNCPQSKSPGASDKEGNISMNDLSLPLTHKCAIHALVGALLCLVAQICELPELLQYTLEILECRKTEAPHMLPEFAFNRKNRPNSASELHVTILTDFNHKLYPEVETLRDSWVFQQEAISSILMSAEVDVSRLSTSFIQKPLEVDGNRSMSDVNSIVMDFESPEASPMQGRRRETEEITVESLKKMLAEDPKVRREEEERKRLEIVNTFRNDPFEEIVARAEAKSNHFHNKLNEILSMVSRGSDSPAMLRGASKQPPTILDIQFPDLYVY
ncbi:protein EFR3 homolog B-like isoform X2 [Dreissena polymorpha]|uniref:protein EFR3 homolog B-like isoform X2 n=1 Tax=Dreissena polymorpha TaxID=45954 RepID=UPI002263B150|nr:protein EFR3 homolog B-like isoform X2 [Dreissena polymorpha]